MLNHACLDFDVIAGLNLNADRVAVLLALAYLVTVRPPGQALPAEALLARLGDDVAVVNLRRVQVAHY